MGILRTVQIHSFQCYCHHSPPVTKYASLFPPEARLCQRARAQGDLPHVYTALHRVAHCDTAAAVAAKAACVPHFGHGGFGRGFWGWG